MATPTELIENQLFLLKSSSQFGRELSDFEIPLLWCGVSHWVARNIEFITITLFNGMEKGHMVWNYRVDPLLKAEMDTHPGSQNLANLRSYLKEEFFHAALNSVGGERKTFVVHVEVHNEDNPRPVVHNISFVLDTLKLWSDCFKPFSDSEQRDILIKDLPSVFQSHTASIKGGCRNSCFVLTCDYWTIPIYGLGKCGLTEPHHALAFDDDTKPHIVDYGDCGFAETLIDDIGFLQKCGLWQVTVPFFSSDVRVLEGGVTFPTVARRSISAEKQTRFSIRVNYRRPEGQAASCFDVL